MSARERVNSTWIGANATQQKNKREENRRRTYKRSFFTRSSKRSEPDGQSRWVRQATAGNAGRKWERSGAWRERKRERRIIRWWRCLNRIGPPFVAFGMNILLLRRPLMILAPLSLARTHTKGPSLAFSQYRVYDRSRRKPGLIEQDVDSFVIAAASRGSFNLSLSLHNSDDESEQNVHWLHFSHSFPSSSPSYTSQLHSPIIIVSFHVKAPRSISWPLIFWQKISRESFWTKAPSLDNSMSIAPTTQYQGITSITSLSFQCH